jgi:hypothetical protein
MTELGRRFAPSRRSRWVGVALAVVALVALLSVGWSLGAPATIGPGSTEQGQGADVGEQTPGYWAWEAAQIWNIPSPVPGAVSGTSTAPTVLPAATASFRIDPAKAGNVSVRWEFQETTAAPVSTELELRFTDGLSQTAVHVTVYLETRAAAIGAALVFYLYWDAGAYGPSGVNVQTMQVTVLVCTAVGHCP